MSATSQSVTTPTARKVIRRSLFWIGALCVLLIVALFTLGLTNVLAASDPLSADNPRPEGAKALASVLASHGVDVSATDSLVDTLAAISDPATTTVLVYDQSDVLSDEQLAQLSGAATHLVLLNPGFAALEQLAPGVLSAGYVEGRLDADCALPAVEKAGTVTGDGYGYRTDSPTAVTCFGSGDDIYSLVQTTVDGNTISVLGTTTALDNGHIATDGNAALALNLLGENNDLVWYLPGIDDYADTSAPTLGELTPPWVTPAILVLIAAAIAAAVWRGRRFGALVVEQLPVTVRASETMEGRARLYARSSARLHALDSLRIGTIERVAAMCGLPRVATVDEVVAAASEVLDDDPRTIRWVFVDAVPRNDRELVTLSDALLDVERRVIAALR